MPVLEQLTRDSVSMALWYTSISKWETEMLAEKWIKAACATLSRSQGPQSAHSLYSNKGPCGCSCQHRGTVSLKESLSLCMFACAIDRHLWRRWGVFIVRWVCESPTCVKQESNNNIQSNFVAKRWIASEQVVICFLNQKPGCYPLTETRNSLAFNDKTLWAFEYLVRLRAGVLFLPISVQGQNFQSKLSLMSGNLTVHLCNTGTNFFLLPKKLFILWMLNRVRNQKTDAGHYLSNIAP